MKPIQRTVAAWRDAGMSMPRTARVIGRHAAVAAIIACAWFHVTCDAAAQNVTHDFDVQQAQAEAQDKETIPSLLSEGRLLLRRDSVKLDGYAYCTMAVAAAERGDFRVSIEAASRALVIAGKADNADLAALSQRDLAIAYSYAGDLDDAQSYARNALASEPKDPAQVFAPAHKVLGDVAMRLGDASLAIVQYRAALDTASPRFAPLVLLSLTNAQIAAGQPGAARETLDRASAARLTLLAPLYSRIEGNLLLAEVEPQKALDAFASGLSHARADDASYDDLWAHEGMGRAWLMLGDRAQARVNWLQALDDSEKIRARFRSDEFKTGLFGDTQAVFEETISLVSEDGDDALAWSLSERSRGRALLDMVRNRVDDGVNREQLDGRVQSLDDVRRALRPDEAIVEFHELPNHLLAWVVRADGMQGFTLPLERKEVNLAVGDFVDAIVSVGPDGPADTQKYSTRLDALLIEPLHLRAGERLIIVPHGTLHYMPFQALRNRDGYLIERHPIALAPSASVAVQLLNRQQHVASNLVAFGNPSISPGRELPGAEVEVKDIAPLFAQRQTFVQAEATRRAFTDNVPQGRIVHVATHADADKIDPLHSSILLAPPQQPADGPDVLLAQEIYNFRLGDVALVTLSACSTALGKIGRGDEILGLTSAFFYAGASALVVSMWPVNDESTPLIMSSFYRALTRGEELIDAMRTAQIAVLTNPTFAAPVYWAPFDVVGSWRLSVVH